MGDVEEVLDKGKVRKNLTRTKTNLPIEEVNTYNKCMLCKEDHSTSKCQEWSDLNNSKLELHSLALSWDKPFCRWCLEPGHTINQCYSKDNNGCPCESGINKFICRATDDCISRKNWEIASSITTSNTSTVTANTVVNGASMGGTLLPVLTVPVYNSKVNLKCVFDTASQTTFILNETAEKIGLKGVPVSFVLVCTDGSEKPMKGILYKICLKDIDGQVHSIEAIGMSNLSTDYSSVKVFGVKKKLINKSGVDL